MSKLPDKKSYTISEVANYLSQQLDINIDAAKKRVYRAIDNGFIKAYKNFGPARISKKDAEFVIEGVLI